MIHDDYDGDFAGKMEMLQILPSRPTGIDDAETSMADDAVEVLSAGVGDDSAAELLVDVAAEMPLVVHPVGVNMRVLGVLAIEVSEQTTNESRAKDKDTALRQGNWNAQGVATQFKLSCHSNHIGQWPFPDYVNQLRC